MKRGEIIGDTRASKLVVFESDRSHRMIMILDHSGDAFITLTEDQVEELKKLL